MIKYSVRLLLWDHDPNPQGNYPVYLCITISRVRRYIATGIYIPSKHWDAARECVKEGHKMHQVYNPDLTHRKQRAIGLIVQAQLKNEPITADRVKVLLSHTVDLHNIFEFIEDHKKNMQHKRKAGTVKTYTKFYNLLERLHGSTALHFEEIDADYLQRFENALHAEGFAGNYVWVNFKMLRTFFNAARKRKLITCYPFDEYENPKYEAQDKDRLTLRELDKWETFARNATDPVDKQASRYFLFGCCTGLRLSDWYQFDPVKHLQSGNLRLRARKNGEWVTIPVTGRLQRALDLLKGVPLTSDDPVINRSLQDIAKHLKLGKHLTTHCGRHTFAVTMCAEHGIGVEVCAELMGITVATCVNNYYKTTKTKIDAECRKAWG